MLKNYIKLLRIHTWIKNCFVFIPVIFSLNLFNNLLIYKEIIAFLTFCLTSSSIYIINDIFDKDADSHHPYKKDRPIASGKVKITNALIVAFVFLLISIFLAITLGGSFLAVVIIYVIINILYSAKLKDIVIIDVFCIASGFILRIVGGAVAINVVMSSWLILTTMFLSLFLAALKRRSEIDLPQESEFNTRKVLLSYNKEFIGQMTFIAAAGTIICYALYTVSQRTLNIFGTENLIYTTPFVVFGIYRYMYLIYVRKRWEDISKIVLTDLTTIFNIVLYLIVSISIIYRII